MKIKSRREASFLARYSPAEGYLLRPVRAVGKPGLLDGVTANGEAVIIREWPRLAKQDDHDLVEIWRNELRLLHRVSGFPGAEQTIARLIDAGQDAKGFYIVILAGEKRPLAVFLDERRTSSWVRHTSSPANRKRLWENLRRIAKGLDILHSQGLIHCNLDTWSVLTAGSDEPDFQLTGFEWSMRIAGTPKTLKSQQKKAKDDSRYSFLGDWAAFASLSATLLRVSDERLKNPKIAAHEVSDAVNADEVTLLRSLLIPSTLRRTDGNFVDREIEKIVITLAGHEAADNAQFQLVLGVGPNSDISEAIREASDLSIELTDLNGQLGFVSNDLTDSPRLIVSGENHRPMYFLRGQQLVYRLTPYAVQNSPKATWEFAKCEKATLASDWGGNVVETFPLVRNALSLMTFGDAAKRAPRLRGRVPFWSTIFDGAEIAKAPRVRREERLYRALSTLHALELVIASTGVFPITVMRRLDGFSEGADVRVELKVRPDPDRDALSLSLGLRNYRERLRDLLERDNVAEDEGWVLTDAKKIGRRSATDVTLQFDEFVERAGEHVFVFRVLGNRPLSLGDGLLVPGDFRGLLAQFSRKAHALIGLREHSELLRMLSDPRSRLVDSHELVDQDEIFADLDNAKQKALSEITSVLPVYFVQGPPGVGKTFLVSELVRRSFKDEPSSRILLSAQSHHTVDHLMDELLKGHTESDQLDLLAVRCRARDDSDTISAFDVQKQADKLGEQFALSDLAKGCSDHLRDRISQLSAAVEQRRAAASVLDRRALSGLVMRSANLVFATTNSRDLERLFDERGQFDWSIVEEAGKATGSELLMPLLLSHRRLLIGDHNQLPPFGSDQIARLLENPGKIRDVLMVGLEHIDHALKEFIGDDLLQLIEREDAEYEMSQLCSDTNNALYYFKTSVDTELERQKNPRSAGSSIAGVLNVQHRMHPQIANVVSECFYKGEIDSSDKAVKTFLAGPGVLSDRASTVLGRAAVTVIDMPYQQATVNKRDTERLPRYTNADEADAIRRIAATLQPHEKCKDKPSLAIISPYARQVETLRQTIRADVNASMALSAFDPVARGGEFFSTVDAFQGNEADIIIVSLVRNNHHSTPVRALGFVGNAQRMNVLLSRAKWRLFIVTSLDFLRAVSSPIGKALPEDMAFLTKFLGIVQDYQKQDADVLLPYQTLISRAKQ
ncbi:AAA domain-containing protein [Mesorhizobium sp. NZP2077]|uniref:AAA domain-containing protein n=1 Tax=Mesorhizobium sp. NZP2077 TaxID=2483404 RepID=UPI001557487B|nr:AAA domain-containing protein [Mesorhizobium sp. NZP2077]QKD19409.1 hypothetical protein HGP13_32980 [Mesorhizobium sp. NZP2077]